MSGSIEAYFLMNFAVDAALIAVVARANGCFRMRRALLAGLIAALYAVLAVRLPRLTHPMVQLALAAPVALAACGDPDPRRWAGMALQLFCGALLLGGAASLLPMPMRAAIPLALIAGLAALYALLRVRRMRAAGWEVTVLLSLRGRLVAFRALIDTGNRLREPISGLPVLIAESSLLDGLLAGAAHGRWVAFGALGGGGMVRCFRPDAVFIRRGNRLMRAPEVWVAAYPGRIPGASRALAPPSFALVRSDA